MKKLFLSVFAVSAMLLIGSCKGNKSDSNAASQGTESTKNENAVGLKKPKPPKCEGTMRILFVGNSHTEYFVSLPYIFDALSDENNKEVEIATLVEMGVSIDEILEANTSDFDKYFSVTDPDGNYFDYVILQEKTPTAIMNLGDYKKNCKKVADLVLKNSPDAAFYIYELMSPIDIEEKDDFITYKKELAKNAAAVAKALPNAGILPVGSAVADAYEGKGGYVAIKNGKDLLRNTDQSHHMLNDAGFLAGVIIYQAVYGETPKIPAALPLSTGTGNNDEITMQNVETTISNQDALLKIAAGYK